jgi:hypothetical protein
VGAVRPEDEDACVWWGVMAKLRKGERGTLKRVPSQNGGMMRSVVFSPLKPGSVFDVLCSMLG